MTGVLIPTASEAEWLDARRQGITASEIAVVMGLSPYSSPYKLYWQKLGLLPPDDETDAIALGKHMESWVAEKFVDRHPEFRVHGDGRQLFAHPERGWQMTTPDRLVAEYDDYNQQPIAVLECKIDGGSEEWGEDGSDQIPVHYRCQVLWQMDALGVGTGYVACLLWSRRQVRVYELTMDEAAQRDLSLMRREAILFLDRIEHAEPPAVDWRPATAAALKRLHPDVEDRDVYVNGSLARWWRAACRDLKDAERRKAKYENQIRAVLGNGHRALSPGTREVIARRDVYDVPAHTRKASHVDRLVAVPAKPPRSKESP